MKNLHHPKYSIGDLKKGDRFVTVDSIKCEVITPTEDGKGLVARYIEGQHAGEEDFIFNEEIDFGEIRPN